MYDIETYLIKHHHNPSHPVVSLTSNRSNVHNQARSVYNESLNENNEKGMERVHPVTENLGKHDNYKHGGVFIFLHIFEAVCKYGSISILGFFIAELAVKLIFDPKSFLKVLEILDVFVVLVSFSLNIYLLVSHLEVHAITGLITLLRFVLLHLFYFLSII
jgi:hypothetical protein